MTDIEALRERHERTAAALTDTIVLLQAGVKSRQEEIERYKAMVASEHELLNGIIREGETPLDAMRRVVAENEKLWDEVNSHSGWIR